VPDPVTGRRSSGFTLLEMLFVIAILAILATMGTPVLWKEIAKARRTEARNGLASIHSYQEAHRLETGRYGDTFDEIGFRLPGGRRIDERTLEGKYYTFTINALALNGVQAANFQAIATADLDPRDATLDILIIENGLTVVP
jgi:prepilin-type N-terminal cleavage/methylation domain-containing protein